MNTLRILLDGRAFEVEWHVPPDAFADTLVRVDGETVRVRAPERLEGAALPEWLVVGDRPYEILFDRDLQHLHARGHTYALQIRDLTIAAARPMSGDGRVKAPIPGIVTQIFVQVGDAVTLGQPLLILEAMKMENQIRAPRDGTLASVNVSAGEGVTLGQLLVELA